MAILFQDESKIIKCPLCYHRYFYEKEIFSYMQVSPTVYKKVKISVALFCSSCDAGVKTIEVLNSKNIITD